MEIIKEFIFSDDIKYVFLKNDNNRIILHEYIDKNIRNDLDEFGVYVEDYIETELDNKNCGEYIEIICDKINVISNKIIEHYLSTGEMNKNMLEKREKYIELKNKFLYYQDVFEKILNYYID